MADCHDYPPHCDRLARFIRFVFMRARNAPAGDSTNEEAGGEAPTNNRARNAAGDTRGRARARVIISSRGGRRRYRMINIM